MEASLCLQATRFATWRSEGLPAPHRHVAVVPNDRAVQMSSSHLMGAGAQARQLACGGGGWRRVDTWRRPASSPQNDDVESAISYSLLDAMLRAMLRIVQAKNSNNVEHNINEIHTMAKDTVQNIKSDTVYKILLDLEKRNDPQTFFNELVTQFLIYEPHEVYEAWVHMKDRGTKYSLGLYLARQMIYEKDFQKALNVCEYLRKTAPMSDPKPSLLLFIICTSLSMESLNHWEDFMEKYKMIEIPIQDSDSNSSH